ncbi:hypothetical protein A3759_12700 [Thalassolituus sp. HI0120]|nr:hypothetical protein A3759_12700 [Thalassolituus sp. HI0120]
MKRRQLLKLLPTASAILAFQPALSRAESEFERYKRQQQAGVDKIKNEWKRYRKNYLLAYRDYKRKIGAVWADPELSNRTEWVDYSDNLKTKRVIDFKSNEIRISFANTESAKVSEDAIRKEFDKVIRATIGDSYQRDPVLTQTTGQKAPQAPQTVSQISQDQAQTLLAKAKRQQQKTRKGDVVIVTIPLKADAVPERARGYLPTVKQAANKWGVPVPLVLAIMQTESSFNPMARSHIPAFGLMQIVPASAGRDASKHAYGKERLLSGQELFQPQTNIELGCAYLNLLDKRYLRAVKDPQSRLYCAIAAYNTGAGNVARAFTGNTSVSSAAKKINLMTPPQVYAHLRKNLKYEEARNYLYKVTKVMPTYQA